MTAETIVRPWTQKVWLLWHSADQLPDADQTVLLFMPASDDPIDKGWWDGEQWLLGDGMPAPAVEAWADWPEGPA